MAQIFQPGADTIARIIVLAIVLVPLAMAAIGMAVDRAPYVTGQGIVRDQPVPFSHQHHVGELGLDCRLCHTGVERSPVAGLPPTETCMTCHSQLWTTAAMLAPVRSSLAQGIPLHWQRVHRLPDYVFFDHSVHIAKGVGCSSCHGRVDHMPLMRQEAPLTMGWCLSCHRHPEGALRPRKSVFDPAWTPPTDQASPDNQLKAQLGIHANHLTECSVCHR